MWNGKKVRFLRPAQEKDDDEEDEEKTGFFNIFTLHQNRDLGRGTKNCVQESMIPEWMDLVVWGHEHECQIEMMESVVGTFRITQPGSSVATSLVAGEAARKKIGILDIAGKQFRLHTVPLTQVRPFVTTEISLKEHREKLDPDDHRIDEKVTAVLQEEVKVMVLSAREKRQEVLEDALAAGSNAGAEPSPLHYTLDKPHEALVRIRVEHSGFTTLNGQRFGASFVGQVANPEDILLFHRKKEIKPAAASRVRTKKSSAIPPEELADTCNMEGLVTGFLEAPETKLKLLSEKALAEALEEYVEKNLASSLDDAAEEMLTKRQKALVSRKHTEEAADQSQEEASVDVSQEVSRRESDVSSRQPKRKASPVDDSLEISDNGDGPADKENSRLDMQDEDMEDASPPKQRAASQQRGAKRRANTEEEEVEASSRPKQRSARAPAKGAQGDSKRKASRRQKLVVDLDSDSDIEIVEPTPKVSAARSQRGTRGRRVQYNVDGDDDDDGDDDPEVDDGDDDKDDDDSLLDDEEPSRKAKKKPAPSAASRAKKKTPASRKKPTATKRKTSRSAAKFADSDDDEVVYAGSTADLDDDWGTANTRSQL
jgi:double-strand break repair protein MRE11